MTSVELFFEETGHGIPIMLLHGYPLDHSIWQPLIPLMKDEARLIMPDLRGHGRSPVPDGVYRMPSMAEDVLVLLDRLGVQKVVLAGHSMGGYVALNFARAYPQRLAGLALVASHCFADEKERAANRIATAQKVDESEDIQFIADAMLPDLTTDPSLQNRIKEMILSTKPKGISAVLRGMAERETMVDTLAAIQKPVLIIAGGEDKLISTDRVKEMSSLMKKPWVAIIPGAGHLPMLEKTKETAWALLSLIQKVKQKTQINLKYNRRFIDQE